MYGVSSFSLSQDNQAYKDVVTLQHVLNMTKVFVAFPETCRHPGIVAKVLWPSLNACCLKQLSGGVTKLQRNRCHHKVLEWIHSPQASIWNLTHILSLIDLNL